MQKADLISIVSKYPKGDSIPKEKVMSWANALSGSKVNISKPKNYKVGDIMMHDNLRHPYIILAINKDKHYLCGLLTSNSECETVIEQCNSRFFHKSYFTKTLFIQHTIIGKFMGVLDNNAQVKRMLKKNKEFILNF